MGRTSEARIAGWTECRYPKSPKPAPQIWENQEQSLTVFADRGTLNGNPRNHCPTPSCQKS
ncbi:hypothetical protein [Kamptonema formosum]|uniref:hypothetical protein n=1 Tax=Kamptonema formosum TaxID=331992 RepID=UPI000348FAA7|nr:hypothetical protein [Oscillatoria sp. PCC 10802]